MGWWDRVRTTFRGDQRADEIADEMKFHLEMRVEELMADGLSRPEAEREARRKFGNRARLADETRDRDVFGWLDTFVRELRHAYRNLRRRPAFALVAIISLAVGIGANTALFSVVDAVLLKPLDLPDAERVLGFEERKGLSPAGGNPQRVADYAKLAGTLDAVAGLYSNQLLLNSGERESVTAVRWVGDLPRVLRLQPAQGRGFTEPEMRGAGEPVAWISHRLWQQRFRGDPNVTQQSLSTKQGTFAIIGVLPAGWKYPERADVWAPDQAFRNVSRKAGFLFVLARLRDGVSPAQANAELRVVTGNLARQYPDSDAGLEAALKPVGELLAGEARLPVLLLMATAGMVLMIACVNLAGLLLARAVERQREAAIRAAIGAGRASLIRLFLLESLILSAAGAAAGWGLASYALEFLKRVTPNVARLGDATLDARVLLFTVGISLACGLLFGLLPAWQASRVSLAGGLRDRSAGPPRLWLRGGLSVAQVALSLVLLILTSLLTRGLVEMRTRPLGFAPDQVLTVQADFPWDYPGATLQTFTQQALERLAQLPGVRGVGVADRLPLQGGTQSSRQIIIRAEGLSANERSEEYGNRGVSPGYFASLGIPLRGGRLFEAWRGPETPRQAVVNETFARRYFGNTDPVGQSVSFDTNPNQPRTWWEITGVVGDVPTAAAEPRPRAEIYRPLQSVGWPLLAFVIRTDGDPRALATAARRTLMELDSTVVPETALMTSVVEGSWREPSLLVSLMSGFSLCALALALMGVYGVLASEVAARTQEIGIRMALGASRPEVLWLALRRGLRITAAGTVAGLALAFLLGPQASRLLFGVSPRDAGALGFAVFTLLVTAAAACYWPARQAASVDPVVALRHE
jgi:putative ABC transport system permease protein